MIRNGVILIVLSLLGLTGINAVELQASKELLPEKFTVYVDPSKNLVSNTPYAGFEETVLPTYNDQNTGSGCYLLCKSSGNNGVYKKGAFAVFGQIRVKGAYSMYACEPDGYNDKDISQETQFVALCKKYFPNACSSDTQCSVDPDTVDWFSLEEDLIHNDDVTDDTDNVT